MKLLSPSMFTLMLLISLVVERPWTKFAGYYADSNEVMAILFLGSVGGLLAIAMVLCEFYLILHATAIILMIGGVIKEMTTIMIGWVFLIYLLLCVFFVQLTDFSPLHASEQGLLLWRQPELC